MQKGEQLQDSHQVYIYVFIFTFIYIRGGWVRAVLNQSTTHCYFGDRDVHAMGTCSATLNDDRGGVCTRGCLNEPLPLPCGCKNIKNMKEPLRRKRLIHEIPHPNTS